MIDDYLYKTGLGRVQNEMIGRRLSPHYQKDVKNSGWNTYQKYEYTL